MTVSTVPAGSDCNRLRALSTGSGHRRLRASNISSLVMAVSANAALAADVNGQVPANANLPVCCILAGGQARRMGGSDKPLTELSGKPILAHVIARMAPQSSAL